ncbi:MAG: hypothetical protein O4861_17325 [Trichodesmium sp. St16_bin4-tuft]|nr:hypothetical protein [Trichodesmium erythraeum GBRTRLIN201]MCH2049540.1 hypothetical protein [Trichodesmium sp. ALOHA_ZT_67]MCL2928546.1 hypothetical protein [Trichodesmium sp. MAG_R01]MDE5070854.1 hypothetical protein [Trichodesmium sp. St5_bin8]MDE5079756.1 hypothetical protein [Trichodesmium sp. St2_bin6]MDE5090314.1 hypothetical protein [Trichodesmium sp. St18_bin3_1_1]MDE5093960.1 hypothetical protein [Trichodesmium sp. St11_bin5]MDE5099995.1 hypothetical protein [Trichodesmium sp. S
MIFRLVAIATYSILAYGAVNRPVVKYKSISVQFKQERPIFFSNIDNNNMLYRDGIYLFGESEESGKIQNEYFVFELKGGKVIGAFYMLHSSFYCFYGIHQEDSLQVKVIDSYDETASDYTVNLRKYYRRNQVSDNDFRMLKLCKTNYEYLVW